MSVLVNKDTKVLVQGLTGKTGTFHTEQALAYYGTQMVGGVHPKKGGESWTSGLDGSAALPIFASVAEGKEKTGATVVGPKPDQGRIPGIDVAVDEADTFRLGEAEAEIFFIPGHTRGHIAFWFRESKALFSGDTLFLMGCGRLFEGTPEQMWSSLSKLRELPGDTRVYCGHEYTQANLRFALAVEPDNEALQARAQQVEALRAEGKPTVPGTMSDERATNPFLRADEPSLARHLGLEGVDPVKVFAEVRQRKDSF